MSKPDDSELREAMQTAADALSQALALLPAPSRPTRRTVLINVKGDETLAIALAERAQSESITQKQVIMRALAAAGLRVNPLDLEDRTPRRRTAA